MKAYYRPIPSLDPAETQATVRLGCGWATCCQAEVLRRGAASKCISVEDVPDEVLQRWTAPRTALLPLSLDHPRLMGILNVTPDSFSDGGRFAGVDAALAQARKLAEDGADILDIGGESTRPGALEIPAEEEIARVTPVVAAIQEAGLDVQVSLDTRKAAVARAGLDAGGTIINDVSAFRFDPHLSDVAARAQAPVILMHSIATPETMQDGIAYDDVVLDVYDALEEATRQAEAAGIPRDRIIVDPGIGFGKEDRHNIALMKRLSLFHSLGCAILVGVSRKGFIGRIANISEADKRDPGSAALGLWAISQGVQILRVHDIAIHRQTIALWQTISASEPRD